MMARGDSGDGGRGRRGRGWRGTRWLALLLAFAVIPGAAELVGDVVGLIANGEASHDECCAPEHRAHGDDSDDHARGPAHHCTCCSAVSLAAARVSVPDAPAARVTEVGARVEATSSLPEGVGRTPFQPPRAT